MNMSFIKGQIVMKFGEVRGGSNEVSGLYIPVLLS